MTVRATAVCFCSVSKAWSLSTGEEGGQRWGWDRPLPMGVGCSVRAFCPWPLPMAPSGLCLLDRGRAYTTGKPSFPRSCVDVSDVTSGAVAKARGALPD